MGERRTSFRRLRRLFAAASVLTALAAVTPAVAGATTTPAPGYEQFVGCPHPGLNPEIETCFRSVITGGVLELGSLEIPLTQSIALSGGMTGAGSFDSGPKGGLQVVKQSVPGGVIGLTGFTWLAEFLGSEALALYAVIELADTPGDQLAEPASLPVKVHLINSVLGNKCYVGSKAEPIELELITGTTSPPSPNTPITGAPGTSTTTLNGVTDITGGKHVDNAFAAPGASGCVLTLFGFPATSIDEEIDSQTGLPAEAGYNRTIQNFTTEFVSSALVYP